MRNMSNLGFAVLGQLQAAAAGGSAMAADTSALYWFEPNTGVTESGTITAWTDNTGNGVNLTDTDSGADAPTWNSAPYMAPDGTKFICTASTQSANTVTKQLSDGNEAVLFAVLYMDSTDQGLVFWSEFLTGGNGFSGNNHIFFTYSYNGGSTAVLMRSRNFTSYAINSTIDTLTDLSGSPACFEVVMGQSTFELFVNGTSYGTGAVTPANFPGIDPYVALAGNGQGATAPNLAYDGRIYEVFASADTSTGNRSAIRSELMTKYGIT